jgi:hypothetical protein
MKVNKEKVEAEIEKAHDLAEAEILVAKHAEDK